MAILAFLGMALCGYLAGMAGSFLGTLRDAQSVPNTDDGRGRVLVFVLLYMIITHPLLQVCKVGVALLAAWMFSGVTSTCAALFHTSVVCAAAGYLFIRLFPLVIKK